MTVLSGSSFDEQMNVSLKKKLKKPKEGYKTAVVIA